MRLKRIMMTLCAMALMGLGTADAQMTRESCPSIADDLSSKGVEPDYSQEVDCEGEDRAFCEALDWWAEKTGDAVVSSRQLRKACENDPSSECLVLGDYLDEAQRAYVGAERAKVGGREGLCFDCNDCTNPSCCCWEYEMCALTFRCGTTVLHYYCSCNQPGWWICNYVGDLTTCVVRCEYCGCSPANGCYGGD